MVLAVALVALSSFPLKSQQSSARPQQGSAGSAQTTNPAPGPPANGSADIPAPSTDTATSEMHPVKAQLVGELNTKTAKLGDSVVVKTETAVNTADGLVIPKGSKLVGRVMGVAPQGQGGPNSQVSIQFDHAEVTNGQSLPIHTVIRSVAPAGSDMASSAPGTSSGDATPGGPAGGAGSGGNASGSPRAGTMGSAPQNAGTPGTSPTTSSADNGSSAAAPATTPGSGAAPGSAPAPGTVVARTGNIAIRTTFIPGVLIANNDKGQDPRMAQSSGILLGAKRDVDLDAGTTMELAISAGGAR